MLVENNVGKNDSKRNENSNGSLLRTFGLADDSPPLSAAAVEDDGAAASADVSLPASVAVFVCVSSCFDAIVFSECLMSDFSSSTV